MSTTRSVRTRSWTATASLRRAATSCGTASTATTPRPSLAAAVGQATGTPATAEEVSSTKTRAAKVLRDLDFDVLSPEKAETAAAVSTTSIPNQRRTNGLEPVVAVCPTCFLALTASGVCDNCD